MSWFDYGRGHLLSRGVGSPGQSVDRLAPPRAISGVADSGVSVTPYYAHRPLPPLPDGRTPLSQATIRQLLQRGTSLPPTPGGSRGISHRALYELLTSEGTGYHSARSAISRYDSAASSRLLATARSSQLQFHRQVTAQLEAHLAAQYPTRAALAEVSRRAVSAVRTMPSRVSTLAARIATGTYAVGARLATTAAANPYVAAAILVAAAIGVGYYVYRYQKSKPTKQQNQVLEDATANMGVSPQAIYAFAHSKTPHQHLNPMQYFGLPKNAFPSFK